MEGIGSIKLRYPDINSSCSTLKEALTSSTEHCLGTYYILLSYYYILLSYHIIILGTVINIQCNLILSSLQSSTFPHTSTRYHPHKCLNRHDQNCSCHWQNGLCNVSGSGVSRSLLQAASWF